MQADATPHRRFLELCSFYQNGTLNAEDQQWMQSYLQQHPQARAHLKMDAVIHQALASVQPVSAESLLVARFMQRWQAAKPAPVQAPGVWLRMRQLLHRRAALIAALACLELGQLAYIASLTLGTTYSATRGGQQDCLAQPLLRVAIQPRAAWEDVALLIRKSEVHISHGPSESGEVWLGVPANRSVEAARLELLQSPLLQSVVVVPPTQGMPCPR